MKNSNTSSFKKEKMEKIKKIGLIAIVMLFMGYHVNAQLAKSLLSKVKGNRHLEDQGITNAVHEKYKNQIVWSNHKIALENPDESAFKARFNAGEMIFGRFYLSESMQNFIYKQKKQEISSFSFYYDVYIDGIKQDVQFDFTNIGYDYCTVTTWQIKAHVPKVNDNYGSTVEWVKLVNKAMTPGEHTVKFDLRVKGYEGIVVSGSFIYVKGNEEVKYGWTLDNYNEGMKDAALEADILKCIRNHAASKGWKEKFTKVRITSTDWYIITKEYTGVIMGRSLDAYCLATWPDGHCTVQVFSFSQQYNGSGYSKTFTFEGVGQQEDVDCN